MKSDNDNYAIINKLISSQNAFSCTISFSIELEQGRGAFSHCIF